MIQYLAMILHHLFFLTTLPCQISACIIYKISLMILLLWVVLPLSKIINQEEAIEVVVQKRWGRMVRQNKQPRTGHTLTHGPFSLSGRERAAPYFRPADISYCKGGWPGKMAWNLLGLAPSRWTDVYSLRFPHRPVSLDVWWIDKLPFCRNSQEASADPYSHLC
jgi:hypothetical protein